MAAEKKANALIIGGGLAGIVTALELLRAGRRVTLVDRDTPERLGGLALWAFGGMVLVGTPLQARRKIADSPERALADWLRFGELAENQRKCTANTSTSNKASQKPGTAMPSWLTVITSLSPTRRCCAAANTPAASARQPASSMASRASGRVKANLCVIRWLTGLP